MTTFSLEMSLEDGISYFKQKALEAQQDIISRGFVAPKQPVVGSAAGTQYYRGELPPDLTVLNDGQLGTTLGLLSEWGSYVQAQLAEVTSRRDEAKITLEFIEAKLRLVYQKDQTEHKKRSNPERDDYVGTDPRYVQAKGELHYWESVFHFIKAVATSAEQSFSAVSRRITQRGQEVDRVNRNTNAGQNTNPVFGNRRGNV